MDLNKYKNDGWGIAISGFEKIVEILNNANLSNVDKYNILEFGSGISTHFFVDFIQENKLKNVYITSFENDPIFMTKARHPQLDLKLKMLVTCNDIDYNEMFNTKIYNSSKVWYRKEKPESRQKNCFYEIEKNDIPDTVDFMLLDGPSGNGRNFAFLHVQKKLHSGSIVFIDDYNHYDFIPKFKSIFNAEEIFELTDKYGCYMILKVL